MVSLLKLCINNRRRSIYLVNFMTFSNSLNSLLCKGNFWLCRNGLNNRPSLFNFCWLSNMDNFFQIYNSNIFNSDFIIFKDFFTGLSFKFSSLHRLLNPLSYIIINVTFCLQIINILQFPLHGFVLLHVGLVNINNDCLHVDVRSFSCLLGESENSCF